ncbi:MAG: hypothetical protein H6733_17965 [Alphaproteobacteria bacterium]|nr:hypothetical protein [Alphaproteobacteria bacterium]
MSDDVLADAREVIRAEVEARGDRVCIDALREAFPAAHPGLHARLEAHYRDRRGYSWKTYVARYARTVVDGMGFVGYDDVTHTFIMR